MSTLPPTSPNYEVLPSFKSLHSVNIQRVATEHLPTHPSWTKHASRLDDHDMHLLLLYSLWTDVLHEYVHRISACVVKAVNRSKLKSMQRFLVEVEEEMTMDFAEMALQKFFDFINDKEG